MKKSILLVAIFSMAFLMAACGAQKTEFDRGQDLFKAGDCASAIPYFDDTIAHPHEITELAYAYFLKGRCAEQSGDAALAYENFYAAKIVGCYAVAQDVNVGWNTYGRSEFCQEIIPNMLTKIAPDVGGADKIKAITDKVDATLHEQYLKKVMKVTE